MNPLSLLSGGLGISSSATQTGDSESSALAEFYFSSPFAVGSGARATSDQAGAGAKGQDDLMKTALYVVGGLAALAVAVKLFRS